MDILVTRPQFGQSLRFTHDPSARLVTGPDADQVLSELAQWEGVATLYGTQSVAAPDPLGSARDMAAMLATCCWELPPHMQALLPKALPIPDGAVA